MRLSSFLCPRPEVILRAVERGREWKREVFMRGCEAVVEAEKAPTPTSMSLLLDVAVAREQPASLHLDNKPLAEGERG
jgi:hypothetical protein